MSATVLAVVGFFGLWFLLGLAVAAVLHGCKSWYVRRARRRPMWSPFDADGELRPELFTDEGFRVLGDGDLR